MACFAYKSGGARLLLQVECLAQEPSCTHLWMQVICHGIPDKRVLQDGDIVNVDVTAYFKGYHGDLNETYVVGEVDDASKQLIKTAYQARLLFRAQFAGNAASLLAVTDRQDG